MRKTTLFLIVLSALLFFFNTSYAATALEQLANSMQPGEWKQLNTNGFDNGQVLEPCYPSTSNIVEYADSASWDPISKQFLFLGNSHGTCYGSRFITYSDSDNTWRIGALPPGISPFGEVAHAYHHNTVNPATGEAFYIHYMGLTVYRYDTNGTKTWSIHSTIPLPRGMASCCRALEYFPEMNGLLYVDGMEGVWFYSNNTKQWSQLANTALLHNSSLPTLQMGQYENVAEYNPLKKVVIFGGGRGSGRIFYKMDSTGKITRMKDAPDALFEGTVYSLSTVDPVSGKYLAFLPGGRYYEYDVTTDAWLQMTGMHPLTDSYGYFELAEAPITTYGVNMFVMHTPARVYIYKHSSGTTPQDTAPPTTPTGLSATAISSSQINLSWSVSTDNVGVTGYRIYRGGTQIATSPSISYQDAGLSASTTYTYTVAAYDAAGNISNQSSSVSATTFVVGSSGDADFQARCSASGVVKCFGFDSQTQIDPFIAHRTETVDTTIKASGAGSMRLTFPSQSAEGAAGWFWQNFSDDLSVQFGANEEFYIQWRQRFSPEILNTHFEPYPITGFKQLMIEEGDRLGYSASTCTEMEIVTQNSRQRTIPQMYHSCETYEPLITYEQSISDYYLQNAVKCEWNNGQGPYGPPCVQYKENQWMTFQIHVKVGPEWTTDANNKKYNSTIQLWVAEEGQQSKLVIDFSPESGHPMYLLNHNPLVSKYGKAWLLPFMTNKDASQVHPSASTWYDELIISRNRIADPVTNALKGDVNTDSLVDILDVQSLVNHILGIQDYGTSADVNADSSVNVLDVQEVVNIILGV